MEMKLEVLLIGKMVYLRANKFYQMVLLGKFRMILYIGLLLLPIFSEAQSCIGKLKLDELIEDYMQKTNSDGPNDVLVMVVSCSKSDTLELSLSHTSSAQTLEYINAKQYYLYGKDYVLVRLFKCENNHCISSLPFQKLDDYTSNHIFSLLLAPDILVNSDYSTVFYRLAKGYTDSLWYNSSNDIPTKRLYIDQYDNDYILSLNYEQIRNSIEISFQISLNTRIETFSFYVSEGNKSVFCFTGTNGFSYKFPKQFEYGASCSDLGFVFQINDSIIKKSENDTIVVVREKERYKFVLPY